MTLSTKDATALKLHTAPNGDVWFADGDRVPVNSGVDVDTFIANIAAGTHRMLIRVLGTNPNARLITRLHQRLHRRVTIEVASPMLCRRAAIRRNPQAALFNMRKCELPPSLGGWHQLSDRDYPAYALSHQIQTDRDFTDHVSAIMKGHPAWYDLRFIDGVNPEWAAWLLTFIIDPRWYVDTEHPDRLNRLYSYLGLTPAVMHKVCSKTISTGVYARCRAALGVWHDSGRPPTSELDKPGNFVWRRYVTVGDDYRGALRATQLFIAYLRYTWLQAVSPAYELFVPQMFFKNDRDLAAYQAHAAGRASSV